MNRAELRRGWREAQKHPGPTPEQVQAAVFAEAARQRACERLVEIRSTGWAVKRPSFWKRLWARLRRIL
jgi:hypothetical protein